MKRYDSYKDSGVEWIGEIPSGWSKISLGKIGILYGGLTGKSGEDFRSEDNPSNKPFIPFTNVFNNTYISKEQFQFVLVSDDENQNRVKKFDLFFLMSSEDYEDLGKSSILIDDVGEVYLNSFCKGFRLFTDEVFPLFLNYQLNGYTHKKLVSVEGNGFTRINLRQDRLKETPIFFPSLPEQQQIVSFLNSKTSQIDELIQKKERKIELLKEYRTSLINQVVTKGLNPNVEMKDSGVEWIGEIPIHWEVSKFKYHSEIVTGNTPSKMEEDIYYTSKESGFPWVKPSSLSQGFQYVNESEEYLTELGKSQTRTIPKESIMVCSIGNTLGKFGISGLELSTNQQINSVVSDGRTLLPRFCLFFVSVLTVDLIKWTNFVTLPIFTKTDFENTQIIVPPFSEQQQIVDYLDEQTQKIDTSIQIEERKIELLKEYRQSLISSVVTGKIDVRTN